MTLAPWRSALARALHRNRARAYSRYLQLATITKDGKPSNRTVVFRGFTDDALQVVTDSRSEKVQHLQVNAWAEACWYFTVTREQFRIAGQLTLLGPDNNDAIAIRQVAWQRMSANARQQFYWPHPGQIRKKDETAFEPTVDSSEQPPDSFSVLLLTPNQVDYLALKGSPQDRYIYKLLDGEWTTKDVNP